MKLIIPTDLSEIKLSQFKRYQKVLAENPDDEVFVCINMIAIFCNIEIADVMKIPSIDFAETIKEIAMVLDQEPKLTTMFKMNGVNYGFIPNLEKISIGEHATIDSCFGNDDLNELMLSTMYRKVTKRIIISSYLFGFMSKILGRKKKKANQFYDIEAYTGDETLADNFKDTPMHIVRGSMLFFWDLSNALLNNTLSSIPKKAKAQGTNLEEVLMSDGVGINLLSDLQENLDVDFQMLKRKICTNHSRYYLT
jgi:hypothetical protein